MTKQIEDYTKHRERLRKEAEEFIKRWVELKKSAVKAEVILKKETIGLFGSNPKLSTFTEKDRINFRK